jgi:hypothetical protein
MRTDQTFTTGSEELVLAVSLELAAASWKVALHDGRREKPAVHTVAQPQAAARLQAVLDLIEAGVGPLSSLRRPAGRNIDTSRHIETSRREGGLRCVV